MIKFLQWAELKLGIIIAGVAQPYERLANRTLKMVLCVGEVGQTQGA